MTGKRTPPVRSPVRAVMEFWADADQRPSEAIARRLNAARPRPFFRPPIVGSTSRFSNPTYLWRFDIAESAVDKERPSHAFEAWCEKNAPLIRAARRAGLDVRASLQCSVRHVLFNVPIVPQLAARLARLGVPLTIVFQATS